MACLLPWRLVCSSNRSHKTFTKVVHVPHLFLYNERGSFTEDLDVTDGTSIVLAEHNGWRCHECGAAAEPMQTLPLEDPTRAQIKAVLPREFLEDLGLVERDRQSCVGRDCRRHS